MPTTPLFPEDLDPSLIRAWIAPRKPNSIVGSTSPGGIVTRAVDLSGNGHHFEPNSYGGVTYETAGGANQPYIKIANGYYPGGPSLESINNIFDGTDITFLIVWKVIEGPMMAYNKSIGFYFGGAVANPLSYAAPLGAISPTSQIRSDFWHMYAVCEGTAVTYPGADSFTAMSHQWIDGSSAGNVQGLSGVNSGPFKFLDVANINSGSIAVAELIIINGKMSMVMLERLKRGLAAIHGTHYPMGIALYTIGNSTSSLGGGLALPLSKKLGDLDPGSINFGIPSGIASTISNQFAEIASCIDYDISIGRKPVLTIHTGHNDGNIPNIPLLQNQWWQDQRAKGAKLILISQTAYQNQADTSRINLNTWERANWQTYFDGFVDAGADPLIGSYPRVAEASTLFDDNVHLNANGQSYMANLIDPVIRQVITPPVINNQSVNIFINSCGNWNQVNSYPLINIQVGKVKYKLDSLGNYIEVEHYPPT